MKSIIQAIQSTLQGTTYLDRVDNTSIFLTVDPDHIPPEMSFPAIGIQGGPKTYEPIAVKGTTQTLFDARYVVNVFCYTLPSTGATALTGSTSADGLFDLSSRVRAVLQDNALGDSSNLFGRCLEESESEPVTIGDLALYRRGIALEYQRIE